MAQRTPSELSAGKKPEKKSLLDRVRSFGRGSSQSDKKAAPTPVTPAATKSASTSAPSKTASATAAQKPAAKKTTAKTVAKKKAPASKTGNPTSKTPKTVEIRDEDSA